MTAAARANTGRLILYGSLGFPLAFAALPVYVYVPKLYAESVGVALGLTGGILLASRALDAMLDPWIGRIADRADGARRVPLMATGLLTLALGLLALLHPAWSQVLGISSAAWLALTVVVATLGLSCVTIPHQALGAVLAPDPDPHHERTRYTAWREGFVFVGVIVAALLPQLHTDLAQGMALTAWVGAAAALALGAVFLGSGIASGGGAITSKACVAKVSDVRPLQNPAFRRLVAVFAINGIAAAIPATLLLFFVSDRLRLPQWQGAFLAVYFLCGALALPLWLRVAARWSKRVAWLLSMGLAIAVFVWAFFLTSETPQVVAAFMLICALSGVAVAADLAIAPSMLADTIAKANHQGAEGAYFGIWNLVTKANLAFAAGLTLPILSLAGYVPGNLTPTANVSGGVALAVLYCLVPCGLKLIAGGLLWKIR